MAKNPEALVIPVGAGEFLVNGNPHVGKEDSFNIVGRYLSEADALKAAEAVFESLAKLSLVSPADPSPHAIQRPNLNPPETGYKKRRFEAMPVIPECSVPELVSKKSRDLSHPGWLA
ncbi:hypothetical protein [Vampirovibrio sp.]|uniref:hypothetical protein n=1 Tax=Vampirovibrio sp. TaxID=2717857 RepID=UPI003593D3A8